jgi:cell division cycle protein 37
MSNKLSRLALVANPNPPQDALELSDDSDIEVHPNVDKRSFIRAKQSQIHMERQQRKLQAEAYKHERVINAALLQRLSGLLSAVTSHSQQGTSTHVGPADVAFWAVMEMALGNPGEDTPPPRPEGLADEDLPPLPNYSKMMMVILDEVNKRLAEKRVEQDERHDAFVQELEEQLRTIQDRQTELTNKLTELDQQGPMKITSESYRVGFDSSHVNKTKPNTSENSGEKTQPEALNPSNKSEPLDSDTLSKVKEEDDAPEEDDDNETALRASPAAKTFAQIQPSDYRASHEYLLSHPEIIQQPSEADGLLLEAYYTLLEDHQDDGGRARQYVHQARLLQYCRELLVSPHVGGGDGMVRFFGYMATPGHRGGRCLRGRLLRLLGRLGGWRRGMGSWIVRRGGVLRLPPLNSEDEKAKKKNKGEFPGHAPLR